MISHVTCELDLDASAATAAQHTLKVRGLAEFLLPNTSLASYVYVHQCIKLDEDVELSLTPMSKIERKLARTVSAKFFAHFFFVIIAWSILAAFFRSLQSHDDKCDTEISLNDLLPNEFSQMASFESLSIVLGE